MTIYPCGWVTNVFCVVFVATTLACISQKRLLRRAAFTLPVANASLGVLAGFAGWWHLATVDVMYADICPPFIVNPIALHLFHSRAWSDLYPTLGENRWVHFLILPSLIGTVGGSAVWWLVGVVVDRFARLIRPRQLATSSNTPSPQ